VSEDRLFHDTARALHFRMLHQDAALQVRDTDRLFHIGNFSANIGYQNRRRPEQFWKRIPRKAAGSVMRRINGDAHRDVVFQKLNDDPAQRRVIDRAWRISGYFSSLSTALANGVEMPPLLKLGDTEIDPRIEHGTELLQHQARKNSF
jgi:hypothetical protein